MWCIRSDGRRRVHTVLTRSVLAMEDNTTATRTKHNDVCSWLRSNFGSNFVGGMHGNKSC